MESITIDSPPPGPKGKEKATSHDSRPAPTPGPSSARPAYPPSVALSPVASLLNFGPEALAVPLSRTPSSDLSLVSPFPRSEIAPDQFGHLYQIIAELREQSIVARENVVSLREENTRFRRELDEARRVDDQALQEVRKALEESRADLRNLQEEHGRVSMAVNDLRIEVNNSVLALRNQISTAHTRLASIEERMDQESSEGSRTEAEDLVGEGEIQGRAPSPFS
ncbi:hypothetical protein GLOTRDRAFT_134415 [Gloeophyllum trabeum ATCC 11539]|uniref:Uncharacterized protein n=1 Tax=Gloeophyllum trabeum (strain ATCC 11539 / FP-39264 / Madison 617) TaxID=670483 RepID=S7RC39_GLOTA|nr:uncharacterized protein GLOTRDRAFT_134415 [Gloeophyllum trabeum ATCC 11539]EPQ49949.1 hypothetical protein GLOTRDRAFT_134415 [Gloeophyllum trabeum ATCC 11539]